MMKAEGEIAGATAATAAGIPFALSTMGTTSTEDVAAADPDGRHWFQLYMWKDRDRSIALVDRLAEAGWMPSAVEPRRASTRPGAGAVPPAPAGS